MHLSTQELQQELGFTYVPNTNNKFNTKTKLLFNLPSPTELYKCDISQNLAVYVAYYVKKEEVTTALFLEKMQLPHISVMFPSNDIVESSITPLVPMSKDMLALFINQLKVISLGRI